MRMIKNKNIIVTGGAGFIGINLCEKLLESENFIIIIDNFNEYYKEKEAQFDEMISNYDEEKDYQLIRGNLVEKNIFDLINYDVDYIFHLAAQPGVRYSIQNPVEVSQNNILSTINVFEYSLHQNIKKVIYASSSSVYGNPNYTPLDEDHPRNPISPYAVSKLTGELYADYYYRENELPISSLRFYTVYGPRGRPDMAIRKFLSLMMQDKEILIYGDGKQLRDYTYISDIIDGMILAAESSKSSGEVFNLGCSNPINVLDLVNKMYSLSGKKRKVKHIEKQKGDVEITYSDTSKAKRTLGYYPAIYIDEGLKKTYEWLLNH
jgi:nucleoside-diphosphate-sugar epimerase